jgi:hypothetical protein
MGVPRLPVPWLPPGSGLTARDGRLTVPPRAVATREVVTHARQLEAERKDVVVILPADASTTRLADVGVVVSTCPDRLAEIDLTVESRLTRARVARA